MLILDSGDNQLINKVIYYLEQKHKYILNYIHDYKNDKNKNKMQEDSLDL